MEKETIYNTASPLSWRLPTVQTPSVSSTSQTSGSAPNTRDWGGAGTAEETSTLGAMELGPNALPGQKISGSSQQPLRCDAG